MKRALFAALLLSTQAAQAVTLNEYLEAVEKNNRNIQALTVLTEKAELDEEAGDIDLVPYLTANASYLYDKSPANQFVMFGAQEAKITNYDLGVGKKFSSGTKVEVKAGVADYQFPGLVIPNTSTDYSTGTVGITLEQSLWKDFFGRATRLRRDRLKSVAKSQVSGNNLQKRLQLIDAENAFWDYIYTAENVRIAKDSLDRSQRIESWTRRRVNDGINDRADLYQAQALLAARQLQLDSVINDNEAAKRAIRVVLELGESDPFPSLQGNVSDSRPLDAYVRGKTGKIVQLQAYMAALEAKAAVAGALEVEDSYRPDLKLTAAYSTNSKENAVDKATQNWLNTDVPTAQVGLHFTYLFDTDVKSAAKNSAKKNAVAARLQSERKMIESESAWLELNRQYKDLSKRVEIARQLADFQLKAAKAQSDLFNKGRSITNTVVTAEQDAAEAGLSLTRLQAEQRKMEAQGQLFIVIEE